MQDTQRNLNQSDLVDPSLFSPVRRPSAVRPSLTKILLVEFRNGEAVDRHPELRNLIREGWSIRSAVPRIVEGEGTKLLVVLGKPAPDTRAAAVRAREMVREGARERAKATQLVNS